MKYIPLSDADKQSKLKDLGLSNIDDLFKSMPESVRVMTSKNLSHARSEIEIRNHFAHGKAPVVNFMGGNGHSHYIPSVIDPLVSRGEFLTAYTPYQPEVSQGTLQAMFEFQSMVAELMGTDIANASLYDGSTSVIEGILMAQRITRKKHVLISEGLHPEYIQTIKTYTDTGIFTFETIPLNAKGQIDISKLEERLTDDIGAVVVQTPNYTGIIDPLEKIRQLIPENQNKTMLIACVTEAMSLGLLKPPGQLADIVCGEAQSFGIPLSFGGPWLGILGAKKAFMRNMPGRLIGKGEDNRGNRAFVVTLAAREQHIRRDKATSNICTNQGLMALRATIYLSIMGKKGIRRAAERCSKFATYARKKIQEQGLTVEYPESPIFNEFILNVADTEKVYDYCMEQHAIAPGTILSKNQLLCAFNETMSKEQIDTWAGLIAEAEKENKS